MEFYEGSENHTNFENVNPADFVQTFFSENDADDHYRTLNLYKLLNDNFCISSKLIKNKKIELLKSNKNITLVEILTEEEFEKKTKKLKNTFNLYDAEDIKKLSDTNNDNSGKTGVDDISEEGSCERDTCLKKVEPRLKDNYMYDISEEGSCESNTCLKKVELRLKDNYMYFGVVLNAKLLEKQSDASVNGLLPLPKLSDINSFEYSMLSRFQISEEVHVDIGEMGKNMRSVVSLINLFLTFLFHRNQQAITTNSNTMKNTSSPVAEPHCLLHSTLLPTSFREFVPCKVTLRGSGSVRFLSDCLTVCKQFVSAVRENGGDDMETWNNFYLRLQQQQEKQRVFESLMKQHYDAVKFKDILKKRKIRDVSCKINSNLYEHVRSTMMQRVEDFEDNDGVLNFNRKLIALTYLCDNDNGCPPKSVSLPKLTELTMSCQAKHIILTFNGNDNSCQRRISKNFFSFLVSCDDRRLSEALIKDLLGVSLKMADKQCITLKQDKTFVSDSGDQNSLVDDIFSIIKSALLDVLKNKYTSQCRFVLNQVSTNDSNFDEYEITKYFTGNRKRKQENNTDGAQKARKDV